MTVHHVAHQGEQVEVDVCDGCGSVFLDYFDGEPGAVARSLEEAGRFRPSVAGAPVKGCPDCRVDLTLTPYLEAGGPEIYRCGGCGGAFLLPVQLGAIADYRTASKKKRSRLELLMDAVLDLFSKRKG
jgi:Zn-finger nucleic acid-binding protein